MPLRVIGVIGDVLGCRAKESEISGIKSVTTGLRGTMTGRYRTAAMVHERCDLRSPEE